MLSVRRFPANADSVANARRYIRVALRHCPKGAADTAELLVSETVTNAVVHAHSPAEVAVSVQPDAVRVAVTDESSQLPVFRPPDDLGVGGRGLPLVRDLSDSWGVDEIPSGKTVWFALRL